MERSEYPPLGVTRLIKINLGIRFGSAAKLAWRGGDARSPCFHPSHGTWGVSGLAVVVAELVVAAGIADGATLDRAPGEAIAQDWHDPSSLRCCRAADGHMSRPDDGRVSTW